jgi:hypothetical protein
MKLVGRAARGEVLPSTEDRINHDARAKEIQFKNWSDSGLCRLGVFSGIYGQDDFSG